MEPRFLPAGDSTYDASFAVPNSCYAWKHEQSGGFKDNVFNKNAFLSAMDTRSDDQKKSPPCPIGPKKMNLKHKQKTMRCLK